MSEDPMVQARREVAEQAAWNKANLKRGDWVRWSGMLHLVIENTGSYIIAACVEESQMPFTHTIEVGNFTFEILEPDHGPAEADSRKLHDDLYRFIMGSAIPAPHPTFTVGENPTTHVSQSDAAIVIESVRIKIRATQLEFGRPRWAYLIAADLFELARSGPIFDSEEAAVAAAQRVALESVDRHEMETGWQQPFVNPATTD